MTQGSGRSEISQAARGSGWEGPGGPCENSSPPVPVTPQPAPGTPQPAPGTPQIRAGLSAPPAPPVPGSAQAPRAHPQPPHPTQASRGRSPGPPSPASPGPAPPIPPGPPPLTRGSSRRSRPRPQPRRTKWRSWPLCACAAEQDVGGARRGSGAMMRRSGGHEGSARHRRIGKVTAAL